LASKCNASHDSFDICCANSLQTNLFEDVDSDKGSQSQCIKSPARQALLPALQAPHESKNAITEALNASGGDFLERAVWES
jgi:hypothetical protein